MDQIEIALEQLVLAIRESNEYQRYQAAREALHQYPDLERSVHVFRKKNYQLQNSMNANLFDEVENLERENSQMRKNPIVEEYFTAELLFCKKVQHINWQMVDGLDFEVGFVNE